MEIAAASALNLACLGGLWYLNSFLKLETSSLLEIENAKVYSPAKLLSQLSRPEFLSNLKQSLDNPDEYFLKAFVEGYTDCDKPLKSIIDNKTQLVYDLYFKDEIYSNDSLIKALGLAFPQNSTLKTQAPLFFELVDPVDKGKCLIRKQLNVNAAAALEKVAEAREYKALNWFEKILVYLAFILELIALGTKARVISRGIKIGWTENEYGILLGSALTVYGDVSYNIRSKSLLIRSPRYFIQDKANILKRLKENIWKIKGKMFMLLIPFLLSSIYLIAKAVMYFKRLRRRRLEQRLEKLWRMKYVEMKDEYKCIICFDRPRNIIVKPCLHFSLCGICYNHLERKVCPICKKVIMDTTEVCFT